MRPCPITPAAIVVRYLPDFGEQPTTSVAGNAACERRFTDRAAATAWMDRRIAAGGLVFCVENQAGPFDRDNRDARYVPRP